MFFLYFGKRCRYAVPARTVTKRLCLYEWLTFPSSDLYHIYIDLRLYGTVHKVRSYFWPILTPSLCHTLSHIPGPPKVRHTSQTPRFLVALVQKQKVRHHFKFHVSYV